MPTLACIPEVLRTRAYAEIGPTVIKRISVDMIDDFTDWSADNQTMEHLPFITHIAGECLGQ